MSVDWFLASPSNLNAAMIGSIGLGGTKAWPDDCRAFILWAIENNIKDIVLVDENSEVIREIEEMDEGDE